MSSKSSVNTFNRLAPSSTWTNASSKRLGVFFANCTHPMIDVSGVRSSCATVPRNASLYRLALSASRKSIAVSIATAARCDSSSANCKSTGP